MRRTPHYREPFSINLSKSPRFPENSPCIRVTLFVIVALPASSHLRKRYSAKLSAWFGLDYKRAVAYTLVLVGLFWNGTGALTLGMLGEIKWAWLPALLAGSLLGGYGGAHLAIRQGNRWIKRAFEVISILVGIKLIIG